MELTKSFLLVYRYWSWVMAALFNRNFERPESLHIRGPPSTAWKVNYVNSIPEPNNPSMDCFQYLAGKVGLVTWMVVMWISRMFTFYLHMTIIFIIKISPPCVLSTVCILFTTAQTLSLHGDSVSIQCCLICNRVLTDLQ